jgi:hypothetical protein
VLFSLRYGFAAEGAVQLFGAEIGGDLVCDGARLQNVGDLALSADRSRIGGSVLRQQSFRGRSVPFGKAADILVSCRVSGSPLFACVRPKPLL